LKKSIWSKLFKGLVWLCVLVLFVIVVLASLLFIYEKEAKALVITALNKRLNAEVKIDPKDIELTIFSTFPDCSIQFNKVLLLEALPIKQRDTLLYAGQLNLLFNIKDLWNKKYKIQKMSLKDGVLKPRILANGKNNYTIWQTTSQTSAPEESIKFQLESFKLQNFKVSYADQKQGFKTKLNIQNLKLNGDFDANNFILFAETKLFINQIESARTNILLNKDLKFKIAISVADNKYNIQTADLSLNSLFIQLKGGFKYQDTLSDLEISFQAPQLDITSVLSLLPTQYKDRIKDYNSKGNFYAKGKLDYQSARDFLLESNFGIQEGDVTYQPTNTRVDQINIEGFLKYGNTVSGLQLKKLNMRLNNDELKASGSINNFSNPYVDFLAESQINLYNLQAFWPIDTIKSLKGILNVNAEVKGLLKDLRQKTFSPDVQLNLQASVSDLEAQFKNDTSIYAVESGSFISTDRHLQVKSLKLKRGSSDILLDGNLPGFFNYLSDPTMPLVIDGNLFSNYIKLEDFMLKYTASGGESDLIPKNTNFKLNLEIGQFSYADFSADHISGDIDLKDQKAIISDINMNTVGGSAKVDAFIQNTNHKLNVDLQSTLNNININRLFSECQNFGQTTLQAKNIKGLLSADLDFSGTWDNRLNVDLNSIRTFCNLKIERGELIDFKPLVSLSKFVDLEDLLDIKFSTLQSELRIKDKTIFLPKIKLENSALNISFYGTHTFDNIIDYHIQLVISELLAKRRKTNDEFGPIEEDKEKRRTAFILMTGPLDNPKKSFDRKAQREKIKEDWEKEQQTVKQIFREKFKQKKNEQNENTKQSEQKFELEKPSNNTPKKTLEPKKKPESEDF
jgi:hypothetical protein